MVFGILTLKKLHKQLFSVQRELDQVGAWTDRMYGIPVYLGWFGISLGYQYYGSTGAIVIPSFSVMRLTAKINGVPTPLSDVLRHEYGHAFAHCYPKLVKCREFKSAFSAHHDSLKPFQYSPETHFSTYAATNPGEDFAETFMLYVKRRGVLPRKNLTAVLRRKWRFVGSAIRAVGG